MSTNLVLSRLKNTIERFINILFGKTNFYNLLHVDNSKIFNITSECFSIFGNMPPPS